MNKRGQVTIFIVLGIVVLAIIGLVLYLRGDFLTGSLSAEEEARLVSLQIDPVKQHVIDCTRKELVKGVHLVSGQGGYYDPVEFENLEPYEVSYACVDGEFNRLLPLSLVGEELNQYIESPDAKNNIKECLDGFKFFEDKGLTITEDFDNSFSTSNPVITETKIRQEINYPIELSRGEASADFTELNYDFESRLHAVHQLASDYVTTVCDGNGEIFRIEDYIWDRREEYTPQIGLSEKPVNNLGFQYRPGARETTLESLDKLEADGEPLIFNMIIDV